MATKVVKSLKRSHSVEDVREAKVVKSEQGDASRSTFLREALKKIELIQSIISQEDDVTSDSDSHESDDEEEIDEAVDAESLGFAMCARETISFLISEGFPADSDIIHALKERLVGRMRGLPF